MKNLTKIIATILITTLAFCCIGSVGLVNATDLPPQDFCCIGNIRSTRDEFARKKYTKYLRAPSKHFFLRQWFRQDNYKLSLDEASEEYLRLVFAKVLTNMEFNKDDVEYYSDKLFLEGHIVKAPVYEFIRAYSLYNSD